MKHSLHSAAKENQANFSYRADKHNNTTCIK